MDWEIPSCISFGYCFCVPYPLRFLHLLPSTKKAFKRWWPFIVVQIPSSHFRQNDKWLLNNVTVLIALQWVRGWFAASTEILFMDTRLSCSILWVSVICFFVCVYGRSCHLKKFHWVSDECRPCILGAIDPTKLTYFSLNMPNKIVLTP